MILLFKSTLFGEKTDIRIEQVGKGASGPNTKQNPKDPERAPAGSKPLDAVLGSKNTS